MTPQQQKAFDEWKNNNGIPCDECDGTIYHEEVLPELLEKILSLPGAEREVDTLKSEIEASSDVATWVLRNGDRLKKGLMTHDELQEVVSLIGVKLRDKSTHNQSQNEGDRREISHAGLGG